MQIHPATWLASMIFLGVALGLSGCGSSSGSMVSDEARRYEDCYAPEQLTSPDVAGHRCTWLHEALSLQERLDRDRPLGRTQWHATHNSFNSAAYSGFGYFDFNQPLSIADQLSLGVRTIELDAHWYENDQAGTVAPVLCHAQGADVFQIGCTKKARLFSDGVQEVADFLARPGNEQVVLIVGVEDVLEEHVAPDGSRSVPEAHDQVVASFEALLGDKIYRPPPDGVFHPFPRELTKAQVLAAGAQVLLKSGPGSGSSWAGWFFDDAARKKANTGFTPYPDCESSFFSAADYDTSWTRVWEDSTFISSLVRDDLKRLDPSTLAAMRGCGLNETALDQLRSDDDRATSMVWSWAPGEPRPMAGPSCAFSQADGHFGSSSCAAPRRAACRVGDGWAITASATTWAAAAEACSSELGADASLAVPGSGLDNEHLKDGKRAAGASEVWLAYRDPTGRGNWTLTAR